jgi:[acyl-carrier-protein] S-malonyltransferase
MNVVLLFPGQGSQVPGMGKDLAEAYPAASRVFSDGDAALGIPLSKICFEGPGEDLTLTHNAQPALLLHGAAVWAVVRDRIASKVVGTAGHSLGEFTAYHAAGALSLVEAVRLVRRRGELMYQSGLDRPGAMAAILGDPSRPVEDICAEATESAGLVVPANYNSPGQVVISGEHGGVDRAMELAREAGAKRAIRLNVSGAFHSPLMETVAEGLLSALERAGMVDPAFPVYSNVTGEGVTESGRALTLLGQQLTHPVRWTDEVTGIARQHPDALFVEMGPGTVLSGLVKKILPGARTVACGRAADVEKLLEIAA